MKLFLLTYHYQEISDEDSIIDMTTNLGVYSAKWVAMKAATIYRPNDKITWNDNNEIGNMDEYSSDDEDEYLLYHYFLIECHTLDKLPII